MTQFTMGTRITTSLCQVNYVDKNKPLNHKSPKLNLAKNLWPIASDTSIISTAPWRRQQRICQWYIILKTPGNIYHVESKKKTSALKSHSNQLKTFDPLPSSNMSRPVTKHKLAVWKGFTTRREWKGRTETKLTYHYIPVYQIVRIPLL